uniref:Clathrin light chain n=1 Tax=Craspedostauros australis TaxID=1486917 RepID=A0A7S0F5J0_9STRA|mmetsp:Transcript_6916/g.18773  ORF Transcript_6916/g.18773 Transcript_6916/m.18773 type:complete len:254 (+) Transcript_6916:164-925(+)|eukprot:CAMPEP_0198119794 /NCGR_PEP_ID=MMETSP1442-20131203/27002_1 /TAXON_ID= /ORGANISM="Craspedostauros australis, Strain CCMP3328" /LENGTH=253 /DNA_ID=CAMNT_0043778333 /DNA_START=72 /DNA_END=833 /DNA_ORIENTATION=-
MGDENNFFGMPPAEEPAAAPPAAEEAGFTMIGDAAPPTEAPPQFAGDLNETMDNTFAQPAPMMDETPDFASPVADFASPPVTDFASPPATDFASPPEVEESAAPILLGAPPAMVEDMPAPVAVEDVSEEPVSTEPSPMQKWNEEWTKTLQARKEEENAAKAAMVEKAREELEAFQKKREMAREKRMAKNREDEQAKLEAIEADLENDNSWQRVCKMVELSHDSAGNAEDTKRMRDILILLKNEPARAQAVGAE